MVSCFESSNQFGIHSSIYSMNYSSKFIFLQRTVYLLESPSSPHWFERPLLSLLNLYLHINLFLDFLICSISLLLQAPHYFNYKGFTFFFFPQGFLGHSSCLFFLVNFKINFYYHPPEKKSVGIFIRIVSSI